MILRRPVVPEKVIGRRCLGCSCLWLVAPVRALVDLVVECIGMNLSRRWETLGVGR